MSLNLQDLSSLNKTVDVFIPKIYKKSNNDKNSTISITDFNPKILFNGGAVSLPNSGDTINFYGFTVTGSTTQFYTGNTYNYTSSLFNPGFTVGSRATLNLDYGSDVLNYDLVQQYRNMSPDNTKTIIDTNYKSTLFNLYYKKEMEMLADPNIKMLTGFFNLDSTDIYSLRMNDIIYLQYDGEPSYWIINQIKDYDPVNNKLTEVELIKYK